MEQETTQNEFSELHITEEARQYLKTTSSWTTFYAIICFISVGIMILCGVFMLVFGGVMSSAGAYNYAGVYGYDPFSGIYAVMGVIYLIFGGVMIFPALYLYRFSDKVSKALSLNNTEILTRALGNMKSYWKFMGILTIVTIGLCILLIPISFIVAAFSGLVS